MIRKLKLYILLIIILSNFIFGAILISLTSFNLDKLVMNDISINAIDIKNSETINLVTTKNKVYSILVVLTLVNVLVFILLSRILGKQGLNRLLELRNGVLKTLNGEQVNKITIEKPLFFPNKRDEFDEIAEAINEMQLEVAKREHKLQDKQDALTGLLKILSQKDEELKLSNEVYRIISEETNDGIFVIDFEKGKEVSFEKTKKLLGYKNIDPVSYAEWISLIHKEDVKRGERIFEEHLSGKSKLVEYEYRIKAYDGSYKWVYTRAKAIFDDKNRPTQVIGSNTYIHPKKEAEERVSSLAYFDQLTKLPNRYKFYDSVDERMKLYKENYRMFAAILINIDNFKKINDILGHELGDKLLIQVSEKLSKLVDPEDFLGRIGGDEFIILVEIKDHLDLISKLKAVDSLFKFNWIVEERSFHITASVGVAMYPQDGVDRSELLKNADVALQYAKEVHESKCVIFDSMMKHNMLERHEIENDLRKAIENDEFHVYYQPKISNDGKKIVGFEALVRWIKSNGTIIGPDKFIPIAEETGLIVEIGKIVLEKSCAKVRELNKIKKEKMSVAVNLSPVQFREGDLLKTVTEIIEETGIDPQYLGLEITESLAMENFEGVNDILKEFRKVGIEISLDDFGTGYSSLNYLKRLEIDVMKIDRSFIGDIGKENIDEIIIGSIIHIAHAMNLKVIAEGIETKEQFKYLENLKCDAYQGYLFSKPIPENELTIEYLENILKDI